jgi:hypothetical protein
MIIIDAIILPISLPIILFIFYEFVSDDVINLIDNMVSDP